MHSRAKEQLCKLNFDFSIASKGSLSVHVSTLDNRVFLDMVVRPSVSLPVIKYCCKRVSLLICCSVLNCYGLFIIVLKICALSTSELPVACCL